VSAPSVGFVGLGHMGGPMCARVAACGMPVRAFDLRHEAIEAAVAKGATPATSAADCARSADVLVTMLPAPAHVEDVLLGEGGALAALPDAALAIDMSTSSAAVGRRIVAAAGDRVEVLDAPVADALQAPAGRLQILVGGDADAFERARPVLAAMGDRIVHVGPHGAGYAAKLLVNLQWFVHAAAAAEALVIGARMGIDVATLHGVLGSGPASSSFLHHEALEVLHEGEYGERFPLGLVTKDLALALDLARETGTEAELASETECVYRRALERYGPSAGEMSAVRLQEDRAGIALRIGRPRHG
jgi:3-hydroxyisobutyrate dehydrogenase